MTLAKALEGAIKSAYSKNRNTYRVAVTDQSSGILRYFKVKIKPDKNDPATKLYDIVAVDRFNGTGNWQELEINSDLASKIHDILIAEQIRKHEIEEQNEMIETDEDYDYMDDLAPVREPRLLSMVQEGQRHRLDIMKLGISVAHRDYADPYIMQDLDQLITTAKSFRKLMVGE